MTPLNKHMVFEFCFDLRLDNGFLQSLMGFHLQKNRAVFAIKKQDDKLYFFVQTQDLEALSEDLSRVLPHSLFYVFSHIKPSFMPNESLLLGKNSSKIILTPFLIENFNNNLNAKNELSRQDLSICDLDTASQSMISDGKISLDDMNICIFNAQNANSFEGDYTIMPTDIAVLSKLVVANDKDKLALLSAEKPRLNLRVNTVFAQKSSMKKEFVHVRLADTLFLMQMCKALFAQNIEFLAITNDKNVFDIALIGDDFIPLCVNPHIDFDAKTPLDLLKFEYPQSTNFAHIHLGKKSHVLLHTKKEAISLLECDLPKSFDELLDIVRQGDVGKTLADNFCNNFHDVCEKMQKVDFSSYDGIDGLLQLGLDLAGENNREIVELAMAFEVDNGVRIDYFYDKKYKALKLRPFFSSIFSYRLAGASVENVAFGMLQSLAMFLAQMCDELVDDFKVKEVLLSGNFFFDERMVKNFLHNRPYKARLSKIALDL